MREVEKSPPERPETPPEPAEGSGNESNSGEGGESSIGTVSFPAGSPVFAYDLMRDRLARQHAAIDALDSKVAMAVGFSGALLGILAGFLGLRDEPFAGTAAGLLIAAGCLFALNVGLGIFGLWPRGLAGVTWKQIEERSTGEWPDTSVQWSLAQMLAWATEDIQATLVLKARVVRAVFGTFAVQATLIAVGIIAEAA